MSKVYFIKNSESDFNQLGKDALELLKKIVSETGHRFEKEVPIKVHFGEKGNKTFIPAKCYDETINYLKKREYLRLISKPMYCIGDQGLLQQSILKQQNPTVSHRFRL